MSKTVLSSGPQFKLSDGIDANRLLVGLWQVSSSRWGAYSKAKIIEEMVKYVQKGYKTFDMADHYGPAEDYYGEFREKWKELTGKPLTYGEVLGFTKWVPSADDSMELPNVEKNIRISLNRMKLESLDMVQFHWWDYSNKNYLTALKNMQQLQKKGLIKHLSLTNFDSQRVEEIVKSGVTLATNQVQFSVVDNRPEKKMAEVCKMYNIKLLTYGTLCGGYLSEKYLGVASSTPSTPSQGKYLNIIKAWGGWSLFQKLLQTLDEIAKRHSVSIANVAVRYVLDKDYVGGVIVGARLGISEHMDENLRVFSFNLDEEDYKKIKAIQSQAKDLMQVIGDCGDEYR